MSVRRKELMYQGQIQVREELVDGQLRTNGHLFAVFVGDGYRDLLDHFIDPEVKYLNGVMVISGTTSDGSDSDLHSWRIPEPEKVKFDYGSNLTVKRGTAKPLKNAHVTMSQYRVRVEAGDVDISFDGASVELIGGKRAIVTADAEIIMLESGGGSCCGA